MINVDELGARIIVGFGDGKVFLSESVIWGFIVAAVLAVLGIWLGHKLEVVPSTKRQIIADFIVEKVYAYAESNLGKNAERFAPYMGTIFLYILTGSSLGILGIRPIISVRMLGFKGKIKHMCEPVVFMFPLNILEDCTLPVSLGLRLFGNIFGGMIVVDLWMIFMEYLSSLVCSIPFMRAVWVLPLNGFFDMFEPVIQTYIFVTLTMVFLSKGIAGQERA